VLSSDKKETDQENPEFLLAKIVQG